MLTMIESWVYDNQSKPKLQLDISDEKLKKKLSERITKLCMDPGVKITVEQQSNGSQTLVKRGINYKTFYGLKDERSSNPCKTGIPAVDDTVKTIINSFQDGGGNKVKEQLAKLDESFYATLKP